MGLRKIRELTAIDDSGVRRVINVFGCFVSTSTHGGPGGEVHDAQQLRTLDGMSVKRIGKGRYHIVDTGEMLTSESPEA